MASMFTNFPLISALAAILFAQVVKVPIRLIITREFEPGLVFGTGSMPSSHSAAVSALTTAIGISEGVGSIPFAIAFVFSIITMFDASGVRREAGEHAIILNQLVKDFQKFIDEATHWHNKAEYEKIAELKTLLGHKPIEVLVGALTGIGIAFLIHPLFT
ncbi:divergent PAP2 family protein [Pseudogracilibacillus sp. SO30301A]|uniref:divergent PAP2 family protein n=1 Tax=Pseudogracilibacillus sp. SO30301A TaxID=3098291 RepID=UPI00300DF05E